MFERMLQMQHDITIIGAGLGGLALANVLHRHGIHAAVYELETSLADRRQGGVLDMHEESGQLALRKAGVFEQFRQRVIPHGDDLRVLDKSATIRYEDSGDDTRPEIDRGDLREILLQSLPANAVKWGYKVVSVASLGGGRHAVTFANGETVTTGLLVGADGAWSKVRPLLSDAAPSYLGITFVETHLQSAARHPALVHLVGNGSLFALADKKGLMAHRNGNGQITVYIAFRAPTDWATASGIDVHDAEAMKAYLLDVFADWDDQLLALIRESDAEFLPRGIYTLPVGHRWPRVPGVTVLGDAAHLMSPFAGEGANLALLDGADLAEALLARPDDVEAALASYEAAAFPRSAAATAESNGNLMAIFREDAPRGMLELMTQHSHQAD